jgi:hypothetical protein
VSFPERHLPYNFLINSPIIIKFPSTRLNWAYNLLVSDEDTISWTKQKKEALSLASTEVGLEEYLLRN